MIRGDNIVISSIEKCEKKTKCHGGSQCKNNQYTQVGELRGVELCTYYGHRCRKYYCESCTIRLLIYSITDQVRLLKNIDSNIELPNFDNIL